MLGVFCIFNEGLEGHVNFFSLEIGHRYLWQTDPHRVTPIGIQTQTDDVWTGFCRTKTPSRKQCVTTEPTEQIGTLFASLPSVSKPFQLLK